MKSLQNLRLLIALIALAFPWAFISSCDDEEPDTIPNVSTGDVTNVTGSSAVLSGEIINDGGPEIIASGFVYSSTNAVPTLQDNFTETTTTEGTFTSTVEGLTSSTTYHVRAYAINSKGTGFGEVVNFTTGNAAPVATNVTVTGEPKVNNELTGSYSYSDQDNDAEGASTFQWYVANDGAGAGETAIAGATAMSFTVQEEQNGKYIRFGVTPKAAAGNTNGAEVKSGFVGAVGEATTVTFIYNGQEVTYGIINSSTGKKWLDRNLGAPNTPSAHNDYANYGDLFQWGRRADGHQLMVRNGPNDADMSPVNGETSQDEPFETSSTDNAPDARFIVVDKSPNDWRDPQNNNLWQGVNGANNPCPSGWRIPTAQEWSDENLGTIAEAYTKLKLTYTSLRAVDNGQIFQSTGFAIYWTSTIAVGDPQVTSVLINTTSNMQTSLSRGNGQACRCIKD